MLAFPKFGPVVRNAVFSCKFEGMAYTPFEENGVSGRRYARR